MGLKRGGITSGNIKTLSLINILELIKIGNFPLTFTLRVVFKVVYANYNFET